MRKQIRVFLVAIAAVLVAATVLFLAVNNSFISPYYIHQQREALRVACRALLLDTASMEASIEAAEATKGVVVAVVPDTGDIDQINVQLREAFLAKGLGLSNYWLWEEDYKNTIKNGTQQRVYLQGNLGYSLLVQYLVKEQQLIAAAIVIPSLSRPLAITNTVSAVMMGATAVLLMTLVWWMSSSLEKAQQRLALKNEQMKQLLNHVSHDLKTPIALIKAYTAGMKDGMDDGSFLNTIIEQNDRMEHLTLRLLALSSCEETKQPIDAVEISALLSKELERQMPLFAEQGLPVERDIQQGLLLQSNADALLTIFDNLLSNAAKYATEAPVRISLLAASSQLVLEVKNPTHLPPETDTACLWEPFCVAEGSRNSALSGSGLGLSLVRAAANSIGASCLCTIADGQFCVQVRFSDSKRHGSPDNSRSGG